MKLSSRDHQLLIGAQAFDDLTMTLETLGNVKGMTWVKKQTDLLKSTKRYLKSDYKVMVCASVLSIVSSSRGYEIVLPQICYGVSF